MAKRSNLASVLDHARAPVAAAEPVADVAERKTRLVGANLPPRYARNLALLSAETGRDKKELLQEALDWLFTSKGGRALDL